MWPQDQQEAGRPLDRLSVCSRESWSGWMAGGDRKGERILQYWRLERHHTDLGRGLLTGQWTVDSGVVIR